MRNLRRAIFAGVSFLAFATPAYAQEAADDPADEMRGAPVIPSAEPENRIAADEIVVTGTLLRGIAPGGSQSLTINSDAVVATGASSASQLLANIPQGNTFVGRPAVLGSSNSQLSINRPNLRGLPGNGSGSASTLVLMDGHRLVGMGIRQTTPDTDIIPLGALERVEVVPDGGSSIYGADAVGGVINFITRKRFDGVEVGGKYAFAGDYFHNWEANATVGKAWDQGSLYVAYSYVGNDEVYGRDLEFVRRRAYNLPGEPPLDLTCNPGNVIANGNTYILPGFTPGANRCDISDAQTAFPRMRRHSVLGSLNVDLNDSVTFDVRAYYTNRVSVSDAGPLTGTFAFRPTVTVPTGGGGTFTFPNPNYQNIPGEAGADQTILIDYSPAFGDSTPQTTKLETWGVTPSFRVSLGDNWQANAFFNYGRTRTSFEDRAISGVNQGTGAFLGSFNPYNIGAPGNATFLSNVRDANYAEALQELFNERVVIDGSLLSLPGGDLKVAIGAEHAYEKYDLILFQGAPALISAQVPNKASRTVKAVFGEASIPLFGADNRTGGFHSLTLSASGRYDHYNDFGGTFNPKFGLTWEPTSWLKLRGTWGKSFQAPSLADSAAAQPPTISVIPVLFPAPGRAPSPGQQQVFLSGGGPNLQPQRATTWSLGFDIQPTFFPDLRASLTYYNVDFKDVIGIPPIFNPSVFYAQFPAYYQLDNITIEDLEAIAVGTINPTAIDQFRGNLGGVYSIGVALRDNLGAAKTDGFDFSLNYDSATGFGSIFAGFTGTYILRYQEQAVAGAPLVDNVEGLSRFRFVASAGAQVGNLRGQVTWQHSGGFAVNPNIYAGQSRIVSYNLINLFFKYDMPGTSMLAKDLSFTLNVDNLFDTDPPALRGALNNQYGYGNGFTLGRQFQFGISKKF